MSQALILYGIRECDTCRRAERWLHAQGQTHQFHDLRRDGFDRETLNSWLLSADLEQLINRRSRTWRELTDAERDAPDPQLLLDHPTLIKRPVLVRDDQVLSVGFNESGWKALL